MDINIFLVTSAKTTNYKTILTHDNIKVSPQNDQRVMYNHEM